MAKKLLLLFLCGITIFSNQAFSQISVSDTGSIQQIVLSLVSDGVVVQNIVSNCPSGAFGTFADTTNTLNIASGLMLSSGSIFNAVGPNDMPGSGTDNGSPGDIDLDNLVSGTGATTQDACWVEFDVIPSADTLKFNYVFGSEEYPEFVNAGFNDVFGFFISGPGIVGQKNIAIVPGTANTPVSIDNVNINVNSTFFVDNGDGTTPAQNPNLQYDGHTTVLEARTPVIPCQTYRLKLAVSDVGDGILDSGVFIEKGSLGSFGAKIEPSSAYARFEYGVEGCNNGKFIFIRTIEPSFPVPLRWDLSGTALNGIDFTDINGNPLTNRDTIPAFQDSLELIVVPVFDTINDPIETIILTLFDPCDDTTSVPTGDSVTLLIRETFLYNAGDDDSVCIGEFVQLNSNFVASDSVFWSPSIGLNCANCASPIASPPTTLIYTVLVQDSVTNCLAIDSIKVNVYNFPETNPFSISDSAFTSCDGRSIAVNLNPIPDSSYLSLFYNWDSTNAFVLYPDSAYTVLQTKVDRYFPYEVSNENECRIRDSVFIRVFPRTGIVMPETPLICFGAEYLANPEITTYPNISYSYQWGPSSDNSSENDLKDALSASTSIIPDGSGKFTYELTISNGVCEDSELIDVEVDDEIQVEFEYEDLGDFPMVPTKVDFTNTTFSDFKYDFKWTIRDNESQNLVDTLSDKDYSYNFLYPGLYDIELLATDISLGCERSVTFTERINGVIRPNVITPNGDGLNDYFEIQAPPSQVWQLKVFNRWGQGVFESDDYQNDWNAEGLHSGDYFYEMRLKDSELRYKGPVKVLK